jgi:hypothetical protein
MAMQLNAPLEWRFAVGSTVSDVGYLRLPTGSAETLSVELHLAFLIPRPTMIMM